MKVGGQCHIPASLTPGRRSGTYCIGSWVGPRAGLYGCGKYRPHWDSIPGRPIRSESLYQLCHPVPRMMTWSVEIGHDNLPYYCKLCKLPGRYFQKSLSVGVTMTQNGSELFLFFIFLTTCFDTLWLSSSENYQIAMRANTRDAQLTVIFVLGLEYWRFCFVKVLVHNVSTITHW
jgi:hypothetical protein